MASRDTTMTAYCGFSDGKPHVCIIDDEFGGENMRKSPSIFLTRREAEQQYEDVREITITWSDRLEN